MKQIQAQGRHTRIANRNLLLAFILYVIAIGGSLLLSPAHEDTIWESATIAFFYCGFGINFAGVMVGWKSYKKKETDNLFKTIGLFGNGILFALVFLVKIFGKISM